MRRDFTRQFRTPGEPNQIRTSGATQILYGEHEGYADWFGIQLHPLYPSFHLSRFCLISSRYSTHIAFLRGCGSILCVIADHWCKRLERDAGRLWRWECHFFENLIFNRKNTPTWEKAGSDRATRRRTARSTVGPVEQVMWCLCEEGTLQL